MYSTNPLLKRVNLHNVYRHVTPTNNESNSRCSDSDDENEESEELEMSRSPRNTTRSNANEEGPRRISEEDSDRSLGQTKDENKETDEAEEQVLFLAKFTSIQLKVPFTQGRRKMMMNMVLGNG